MRGASLLSREEGATVLRLEVEKTLQVQCPRCSG